MRACVLLVHEECVALLSAHSSPTPIQSLILVVFFMNCAPSILVFIPFPTSYLLTFPPPIRVSQSFFFFVARTPFLSFLDPFPSFPHSTRPFIPPHHSDSLPAIPVSPSSQSLHPSQPASQPAKARLLYFIPFTHPPFFFFLLPPSTFLLPPLFLRALFLHPLPHVPFLSPTVQLYLPHLIQQYLILYPFNQTLHLLPLHSQSTVHWIINPILSPYHLYLNPQADQAHLPRFVFFFIFSNPLPLTYSPSALPVPEGQIAKPTPPASSLFFLVFSQRA